ncbi:hypothetical protein [Streptomyces sp. NPDC050416]|uniref:hypothetical protein n=1 Tax=Streptomyces sp. NPDC050416 TaxID=3365611 RepID=UPI0037ABF5D1
MNEHGCGDHMNSSREMSAFELTIRIAMSKAEITEILQGCNLSEEHFVGCFPDLAKAVQELPDEDPPSP